ncbi:Hcp family type VI secretion system effector [Montanilutibacter psychrotolerans]|uniref:Type VI secretion system tube protein Hcp n=1 Tax=Montanilutibacter psychrotolerans TaxID=1327343 RepID=A0A3M8SSD7_9GAMM|nr:type VI secretion system tube protein Hcp [Lysobacter psychrotolerans]RNF82396.1 type VI secretion system tube protein Hcp [Lysobacter psychrotolerans]
MQHAFLSIDTIKGESKDSEHKDWIEIESFNQDVLQPRSATASSAGGTTAARVEMSPIEINKRIDLASTALFQACAGGTTFPKAQIQFMRADKDGKAINYYTIELLNVLVHRVNTTMGHDGMPSESVQLSFGAIKWSYTQQKPEGGIGGKTIAQWSNTKNTPQLAV